MRATVIRVTLRFLCISVISCCVHNLTLKFIFYYLIFFNWKETGISHQSFCYFIFTYYLMCMGILLTCTFVHHMHAWCSGDQKRISHALYLE